MRLVVVFAALTACSSNHLPQTPPPYTQHVTNALDVLFVIENAPEPDIQTIFAANFPQMVATWDALPGGRPDLHIGVVTTTVDIGVSGFGPGCPSPNTLDDGRLVNVPRVQAGCSGPQGRYLSDVANSTGGRTTNFSGTLADAFTCIAQVGNDGCGFHGPLEAMKRALDGSHPENAGFLRDDADLAIVFLVDDDDCSADPELFQLGSDVAGDGEIRCTNFGESCDPAISATAPGMYSSCVPTTGGYLHDVASYRDFLASLKDPSRIALALIGGDPSSTITIQQATAPFAQALLQLPSCTAVINGNNSGGWPANRLAELVGDSGVRGQFYSVCQGDYTAALVDIAQLMHRVSGPCLLDPIDARDSDPSNPGVQPACTVTSAGVALAPCQMFDDTTPAPGQAACAYFAPLASCAGTPTGLAVHAVGASGSLDVSCSPAPSP